MRRAWGFRKPNCFLLYALAARAGPRLVADTSSYLRSPGRGALRAPVSTS